MTQTQLIQLKNIGVKYGGFTAIENLSLDFHEGEFLALLGPSGCGKSTLLRLVAGFADPSSGQILLDGQDMTKVPARKRPVNMMFQSYALFPHMSVEANVSYGLEIAKVPRAEIRERVAQILEATHLSAMAKRSPSQLSGGQRQRVALARSLVLRPRVLLLDEPMGALDKNLREAMQHELKRLQKELNVTFVVVTHDQEEALVMADRIVLMRAGKIEQVGTATELYENPNSKFVASFIGRCNFFQGRLSGNRVLVDGLGPLVAETGPNEGSVTYSIRPERMKIFSQRPEGFDNILTGKITEIYYQGQGETLMFALPGQSDLTAVSLTAAEAEVLRPSVGMQCYIAWNAKNARVFAADQT